MVDDELKGYLSESDGYFDIPSMGVKSRRHLSQVAYQTATQQQVTARFAPPQQYTQAATQQKQTTARLAPAQQYAHMAPVQKQVTARLVPTPTPPAPTAAPAPPKAPSSYVPAQSGAPTSAPSQTPAPAPSGEPVIPEIVFGPPPSNAVPAQNGGPPPPPVEPPPVESGGDGRRVGAGSGAAMFGFGALALLALLVWRTESKPKQLASPDEVDDEAA